MIDLKWQEINFYQPVELEDSDKYNLYWMARIWGILALGVIVVYILISLWSYYQTVVIGQYQNEKQTLRAELIKTSQELNVVSDENILNEEIRSLNRVLEDRQGQIRVLNQHGLGDLEGFTPYLNGLASRHVLGTWLTKIRINKGGEKLFLEGRTKNESLIADIIYNLNQDNAFKGTVFSQAKVSQDSNQEFVFQFNTEH